MTLFGGRSFFGMGSKRLGSVRRTTVQAALTVQDAEIEQCAATESAPGELVRRKQESVTEERAWMRRGLFKAGFNAGAPRLRSVKKFTK